MTTTSTMPGGYTSRFVAHVAQTTAHDEATSNSSNPQDRNRFRAFSADGSTDVRRYPAGRVEDDNKVIAATATIADYAFNVDADGDAFKPPRATDTRSSRTDIITDTDKSTTSSTSSHLAISEPESNLLEGGRDDIRVASVAPEDEATLVEGRSGNDEISLVAADRERDGSILAADDDSETRRRVVFEKREKPEDASGFLRIVVEDVDAAVGEQRTSELTNRPIEMIDERRDRSRSKESLTVSEYSSSISGRTMSDDSESESDSGSDSKVNDEEEIEDDVSRDENCNVKKEGKEEEEKNDSGDQGSARREVSEKNEGSSNSGGDEETTVLSVSSSRGESSMTPDDRYERDLKRRSASIIDERSIEEMFDDNGWVITEQDLQQDLQTMSAIPSGFGFMDDRVEKTEDEYYGGTRTEEAIPRIAEGKHDEISNTLEGSSARSSTAIEMIPPSEQRASRNHVYRQSSLGKNGWLVSDESESESERATSPGIRAPYDRDVEGIAGSEEASTGIEDSTGGIDENGWVILDDDDDDDDVGDGRVGERSAQRSTIRSQTTDLVTKTNTENGALLANATRSKGEQSEREERAPPVGANVSIPVQMVTTVFCVSVLCYTVLTNLLL